MKFDKDKSIAILERTPTVLKSLLADQDREWIHSNEGPGSWTPLEIVNHLILGEETDWIVRSKIILDDEADKNFVPFDMESHKEIDTTVRIEDLLEKFEHLRAENLKVFSSLDLLDINLSKTAIHPEFGEVTLRQLLSTWVVHDLTHIAQIVRVMAKQYKDEVGPWSRYIGVLSR